MRVSCETKKNAMQYCSNIGGACSGLVPPGNFLPTNVFILDSSNGDTKMVSFRRTRLRRYDFQFFENEMESDESPNRGVKPSMSCSLLRSLPSEQFERMLRLWQSALVWDNHDHSDFSSPTPSDIATPYNKGRYSVVEYSLL